MEEKTIDAKCPYCKSVFVTSLKSTWNQSLWGEYAPKKVNVICPNCSKECSVSLIKIYKYSAVKIKKQLKDGKYERFK